MQKAKRWLSAGFAKVTPWRVGRLLAMGALLSVATVMYFGMTTGDEIKVSPPVSATGEENTVSSRMAPDRLVIDVQQETGSWDAIKPAATPTVRPSTDSSTAMSAIEGFEDFREDAWKVESPYYEDFSPVGNLQTLDLLDDAWKFDSPYLNGFRSYDGSSQPSYHQQRMADSLEERLEVQQLLEEFAHKQLVEGH